jgi:arylsulfatase
MQFEADEPKPGTGGNVTLWANGKKIGEGRMDRTVSFRFSFYAGMDVARDNGMTVDPEHPIEAPYAFTGTVKKVVFDLKPEVHGREKALHQAAHHAGVGAAMSG